ncbi:MAG: hypothetical protein IJP44_14275 [Bacteroidales bacterium]|nr:hypothetical protein [Bacteroidales bacterium]
MKKSLVIAMCCITVLFAACKKEKPYEKFIGNYEGACLVDATITIDNPVFPGSSTNQDFNNINMPIEATVSAGDADNKLVMTCKFENQNETYSIAGTINKDQVTFDTYTINQTINESQFSGTINATLNMTGTLVNNVLSLTGNLSGTGTTALLDVPFDIMGNMTGTLNKLTTTN